MLNFIHLDLYFLYCIMTLFKYRQIKVNFIFTKLIVM